MAGLYFIGSTVCHQFAERSLQIGGRFLPYCARCTGIYLGMAVAAMFFFIAKRQNGDKPLCGIQIPIAVFGFLPFMIDGLGSYIGLWQSNNLLRIVTGLPAGISLPYFFILLKNFKLEEIGTRPIFNTAKEQLWLLIAGFALAIFVYFGGLGLYYPIAILLMLGNIYFLFLFFGLFISFLPIKSASFRLGVLTILLAAWIFGIGCLRLWLRI